MNFSNFKKFSLDPKYVLGSLFIGDYDFDCYRKDVKKEELVDTTPKQII